MADKGNHSILKNCKCHCCENPIIEDGKVDLEGIRAFRPDLGLAECAYCNEWVNIYDPEGRVNTNAVNKGNREKNEDE